MDAAVVIREARTRASLTLRALAERAGTSHATVSAYESGRKVPRADTVDRLVRAAGYVLDRTLVRRADAEHEREAKGRELEDVLDVAGLFPSRQPRRLTFPVFGRSP